MKKFCLSGLVKNFKGQFALRSEFVEHGNRLSANKCSPVRRAMLSLPDNSFLFFASLYMKIVSVDNLQSMSYFKTIGPNLKLKDG